MSYLYYLPLLPLVYFCLRKIFNGPRTPIINHDSVKEKVILITGSSAGIGKEAALELLRNGSIVIFACRDEKKTRAILQILPEETRKRAIFISLDLSSFESVRNFEKKLSELKLKIDMIINNAGCFMDNYMKTIDNIESTIQSNHLSHMYLTSLLLKHISKENGRIVNVSSDAHKFVKNMDLDALEKDLEFNNDKLHSQSNFFNYGYSKLANIYFTNTLAKYFESQNIKVKAVSLHPGAVRTEIMRPTNIFYKIISILFYLLMLVFFKDSVMGAQTTLHVCYLDFASLVNSGYYTDCKLSKISTLASNEDKRKRFMDYSLSILRIKVINYPEELNEIVKC